MFDSLSHRALLSAVVLLTATVAIAEEPPYRRGVNIAGAEFGTTPGKRNKDYTYNNEATFRYFGEKGFNVLRVPIKWERIQPALNAPLDTAELAELKKNVAWAKAHNSTILIDVHNYCRYKLMVNGVAKSCVIDNVVEGEVRVKAADLGDLWVKLSAEFKDEPAVWGYGLMNEPNGMGTASWKDISNVVIKAIRDAGDNKVILVGGVFWSSAASWEKYNGPESWVVDPANNFIYEAHCYFDHDRSGSYKKTYEEELKKNKDLANVGRKRVTDFIEWCKKNKVRGFLGEFGVPRDDPRWNEVLENFMRALDEAGMGATYWAAGTYWGNYPLSVHPSENFTTDRPQMAVLSKHLSPVAVPTPAPSGDAAPAPATPAAPTPAASNSPTTPAVETPAPATTAPAPSTPVAPITEAPAEPAK